MLQGAKRRLARCRGMRVVLTLVLLLGSASFAGAQQRPSLVPPGWVQETPETPGATVRFVSPDRSAWIAFRDTPAERGRAPLMVDAGERVTYKRSTSRFVAVSGFRGDRIFYRKSNLACGGSRWHQIALEYPAEDKRKMDGLVTRVAHGMNRHDHDDCASSANQNARRN
jgi:hypothetical protein